MADQQSVEMVTCSACNALYREPKVLPCLHCYCKECIQKQVVSKENDQVFRCQKCDKDVDLPHNPENLPTANFIQRIVNLHKIAKQADNDDDTMICGQCAQSTTAPNFCSAGCGFLCPSCEQAHKMMSIFKSHKVVKREELKRNPEQSLVHSDLSPKTARCPKHSKGIEFYCVTCEKPVCSSCVTLEHNVKDHECKTVEECITDCKTNLSHQAQKLRTICDTMLRAVEETKNRKSQLTNLSENYEEEISRTFENVLQRAIACKQELLDEVQHRTQEKLDVLEVQLKQLQPAASEIQHVAEFTEQCYKHADDAELLSLNDMLLIGIQEAIKRAENIIWEPVAQVDFAINVSRCAEKVGEVFQQHATVSVIQPEVQVSGDGLSTANLNETAQFTIHTARDAALGRISKLEGDVNTTEKQLGDKEAQLQATEQRMVNLQAAYQRMEAEKEQLQAQDEHKTQLQSAVARQEKELEYLREENIQCLDRQNTHKYDPTYPGVCFFGDPLQESVDSYGRLIQWPQVGLELDIPPGAVPSGEVLYLSIWPCLSGPYVLPPGWELVSPAYLIKPAFHFKKPVKLSLAHFVRLSTDEDCDKMAFVSAQFSPETTGKKPEYHFRVLDEGSFRQGENVGTICVTHFCAPSIAWNRKRKHEANHEAEIPSKWRKDADLECSVPPDVEYSVLLYHSKFIPYQRDGYAVFAVSLCHSLYLENLDRDIKEQFHGIQFWRSLQHCVQMTGDVVEVEYPQAVGRWRIESDRKPLRISKKNVDLPNYHPELSCSKENYPPRIRLTITSPQEGTEDAQCSLKVLGVSEPVEFVMQLKREKQPERSEKIPPSPHFSSI